MTSSEESQDVALAASGDHEAFERLYRATVPRIYSLARRMAGEDMAEDLTQEVFVRAWSKLGTFRGTSQFSTWLHRLAVNLILSRRGTRARQERRRVDDADLLDLARARPATPGLAIDLESAVERLPEGARRVFVLYDVEGYTHLEIAERMNLSVGTSKSQLHRARMMLRGMLNEGCA